MANLVGQTIRGYEVQKKIGRGGFATVYVAHQTAIERNVALKVILPQYIGDAEFAQRFEHEAKIVARLEHQHIVPVYDFWYSEDDGACMVMRYLEGSSLDYYLDEHSRLSLPETTQILTQVCEALHFAHERDIIHRDMKPGNILLDDDGNAYVTDFGVAKALSANDMHLTKTGDVVGTPSYFAPEQSTTEQLDRRVDIYSTGMVLFECLVGQYPFPGQPFQHLTKPLPSVRDFVPELPPEIDDVLHKATHNNPDERYQTALELRDALQEITEKYEAGDIGGEAEAAAALPEHFVFISHVEDDADAVETIQERLNSMGITTQTLTYDTDAPDDDARREAMLRAAMDGIVVLSDASADSAQSRSDWRAILSQEKRLYTIVVDDIPDDRFPFRLQLTPTFSMAKADDATSAIDALAEKIITDRLDDSAPEPESKQTRPLHLLSQSATFATDVNDIPNHISRMVGRDELLAEIEGNLTQFRRVLLQGLGGIGKTTLAAEAAARFLTRADDDTDNTSDDANAVLWLKVGQDEAATILQALLKPLLDDDEDAFFEETQSVSKALHEHILSEGVGLVVLDDVWSSGAELKKVMDALPEDVNVLLTSRERYPVGKIMDVNVLSQRASVELINLHAYRDYDADDADVMELCDALGRHTLGLEIAGKTMQVENLTPQRMLQILEEAPHTIAMPYGFAEEGRESVKSLLDASIAILDDAASEVFFTFGALPNPTATPDLLGRVLEQENPQIDDALAELQQRGLVNIQDADADILIYTVHDLAHSYARTNRQLGKYRAVEAARDYVEAHQDDLNALDAERNNILSLAQIAYSIGRTDDFIAIVYTLAVDSMYLKARGHDRLFLEQLDNAIQVTRNLDQKEKLHYLLGKRADAYFERGQHHAAIDAYTESVGLAEELDMKERQVVVLNAMYRPYIQIENIDKAKVILDKAYSIAQKMEDKLLLTQTLTCQGIIAFEQGNKEKAKEAFSENLKIGRQLEHSEIVFHALNNLGGIEIYLGNLDKALQHLENALMEAEKLDSKKFRAMVQFSIGGAYSQKGEDIPAKEALQKSKQLFQEVGITVKVQEVDKYMREAGYEIDE